MAVDADDRESLTQDLAEAKEQLAASGEMLTALGRSATDLEAMLDTIVENARRLCRADSSYIFLVDGDVYRLARSVGLSDEYLAYISGNPLRSDRATLLGRVGLDRRTLQITDVLTDTGYGRLDIQRIAGYRTIMGAPMLLDGEVVGVLSVWRTEVDPFDDRAVSVLTSFAAQAAIAMRNVDLVRALEARGHELARKIDQLEALREVGEVVSSSLDLDEVLTTIVTHAVHLSGTDGGSMLEFDEDRQGFRVRTAYGTSEELLSQLRRIRLAPDGTLVGRAAREGRVLQEPDLGAASLDPHLQLLHDAGWRSVVAVPMLREGRIVGALVARRYAPGAFSEETCDLLQTFASQSTLAFLNARLFRELERKTAELEVAGRHKSEFLASMSHELRTPLNAVIGFSEVLLDRMAGDLNDRQEEYLQDIWASGRHLLDLLNDILDLSKVEAGRMSLEPSLFSVVDTLNYGLSLMRERATQHEITLRLDVDPGLGMIEADELRFKQVVLNLLSNAVKFTPPGGVVVVRAEQVADELSVSVTDTGIGVPTHDQERIFDSFQQGGRSTAHQEGTGLGLTLSKRIVELLGGRIWMKSTVGVGSTFGMTLPARAPVRSRWASDPHGTGPCVVVIEDDRRSLELLTLYLEGDGYQVVGVSDGAAGLAEIGRLEPAAVVLDIRLPEIDGWDVLARLKEDPLTAAVPVLVVSILDERGRGMALGASEYLVKPVSRDDVLSAMGRMGLTSPADRAAGPGGA